VNTVPNQAHHLPFRSPRRSLFANYKIIIAIDLLKGADYATPFQKHSPPRTHVDT
jgi:hypothetical protein